VSTGAGMIASADGMRDHPPYLKARCNFIKYVCINKDEELAKALGDQRTTSDNRWRFNTLGFEMAIEIVRYNRNFDSGE
jgi:hypothetical protein